jgi:hypothetical protein
MRWIPTKIPRSSTPMEAFAVVLSGHRPASGLTTVRSATRLAATIVGLAGTSIAGAQEVTGFQAVETASHWPWIAAAAILMLLGAVSFASRRRIYAVVGR